MEKVPHLGTSKAVKHGTDLPAVLNHQVLLCLEFHQVAEQSQPPLLPLRDLLDWQGLLDSSGRVFLNYFKLCDLSQIFQILACY